MSWGYHLLLDCSGCNSRIRDKESIKQFVSKLITAIDMKRVGNPIIEYLTPTKENSGYSLMQMIETSNITAHFVESNQSAYIDVFSCKQFDPSVVEQVVRDYFDPNNIKANFITRNAQ
jgi:S-adenosylmethionine/arginine decarboxylase-like enzyme